MLFYAAPFSAAQVFDAPVALAGAVFVHNNDFHFPASAGCGLTHIHYPFAPFLAAAHWDAFSFFWFLFPEEPLCIGILLFLFTLLHRFIIIHLSLGKGHCLFSVFYFYKNSAVFHKTTKGRCVYTCPFIYMKSLEKALCVFVLNGQLHIHGLFTIADDMHRNCLANFCFFYQFR